MICKMLGKLCFLGIKNPYKNSLHKQFFPQENVPITSETFCLSPKHLGCQGKGDFRAFFDRLCPFSANVVCVFFTG